MYCGVVWIELSTAEMNMEVWVAELCSQCLLGLRFLVEHGCQLDLGQGHMWLGTERLPLVRLGDEGEMEVQL